MVPRGLLCLFVSVAILRSAAADGDNFANPILSRHEQTQVRMGTEFRVVLYARSDADASRAFAAAFRRIAELDAILSDYKDDSELTRLCRDSRGEATPLGTDLFEVLSHADDLARKTEGAFDVTIGPTVRLWRRARRQRQLPTHEQIQRSLEHVGFDKLVLDPRHRTARLRDPGMQLDLGGIAKGYACDQAIQTLRNLGILQALVDGGGGISAADPPPGKVGWEIRLGGVDHSETNLLLKNRAVATSGDIEQFIEIGGVRYSHIVDPKTGVGLTERLQVTVVAPLGITADGLATALCVLGFDRGLQFVEQVPEVAARFIRGTPTGTVVVESGRWKETVETAR